jgi:antitoxin MazE
METKLINIGNSKGIRLPKRLIERYHLRERLVLEEIEDGILIKADTPEDKLSWEDTFKEMSRGNEDWSDLDEVVADGIE